MPSLAQLTAQPLTFKLVGNEKLGAHSRPFFMSKPTIRQVKQNGQLVWQVHHAGMTREFREDWRARWHYEQCIRLSRTKRLGKHC